MSMTVKAEVHTPGYALVYVQPDITLGHMTFIGATALYRQTF